MLDHADRLPGPRCARPIVLLPLMLGWLALPLPAQTVHYACYVPLTGTVYKIKEANTKAACSTGHVEFSWTDGVNAVRTGDLSGGDLSGPFSNLRVNRIQGRMVSAVAPLDGMVLTYSADEWRPLAPSSGGGTSDHGSLTGLADDDHPQYVLANGSREALNGFAVTGTEGSGTLAATGSGTRLLWYPHKAAFRAGIANGDYWDDDKIGRFSFAGGINTEASGERSVAFGSGSTASGSSSTATGQSSTASGRWAVALGRIAEATNDGAVSIGQFTEATNIGSVAIGGYAISTGVGSSAMGWNVTANGSTSVALGGYASTNGHSGTFFFGDGSTVPTVGNASTNNQFAVRAQHIWFGTTQNASNTAGHYIDTSTGAYLTTGGTWTNSSSRDLKENFEAVQPDAVLGRIAALPVTQWNYKVEPASTRHIGPVAQYFSRAFKLGGDDRHIAASDLGGVSLLGIQALERRTRELQAENAALKARLERLEAALERLETR